MTPVHVDLTRPDPAGPGSGPAESADGRRRPTHRWRRIAWWLVTAAFVVMLPPALWLALREQDWSVVGTVLARGDRGRLALLLAGALLASAVGPVLGMLSWRAVVRDLGVPVTNARAAQLFFLSFLSKYLPMKGLGLVIAARLARRSGMTLGRLLGSGTLSLGLTVLTGLTIGLLAGVETLGAGAGWLALAMAPVVTVLWWPHLLNRGAAAAMRILRRPAPGGAVSARGMRRAVAWQCAAWLVSGLHLWLLAVAMDAPPMRSLALCVGAFSLATVAGLLVVVLPDGIGVRDAVLIAALVVVLPVPAAAVVVLASRLVSTLSEVVLSGTVLAVAEVAHRRSRHRGAQQ